MVHRLVKNLSQKRRCISSRRGWIVAVSSSYLAFVVAARPRTALWTCHVTWPGFKTLPYCHICPQSPSMQLVGCHLGEPGPVCCLPGHRVRCSPQQWLSVTEFLCPWKLPVLAAPKASLRSWLSDLLPSIHLPVLPGKSNVEQTCCLFKKLNLISLRIFSVSSQVCFKLMEVISKAQRDFV